MIKLGDILNQQSKEILEKAKKKLQSTYHQQLAVEIAESFNDLPNLGWYLKLCKENDRGKVKSVWQDVLSRKYVKNKAAYFIRQFYKT